MQKFLYLILINFCSFCLTSCVDNDDYSIPPIPPTGFYKETFDLTNAVSAPWPKIEDASGFDNASPITYTDPYKNADVRKLNNNSCVWFPSKKEASLIIDNIPAVDRHNLTLKYKFNAGIYNTGETSNTNKLTIKCNNIEINVPSIILDVSNNKNKFVTVIIPIPDETTKIEFYGNKEKNSKGFRLDDIEIFENLF